MTLEQMSEQVIKHTGEISALCEGVKSAHKRIDENDRITEGIHKLASNVEALTMQVKLLTESMENSIERLENGMRRQGERIGELEKEPAAKWKALAAQVTGIITAAVAGGITGKFM